MLVEIVFAKPTNGRLLADTDVKPSWTTHDLDTLPQWIQERIAVLRLLEEREESPLGAWYPPDQYQPEDPVQLKEQDQ